MKTRVLFAVVALAGGCEQADPTPPPTPVETVPNVEQAPAPPPAARPAVARPRTTANGRPACGNVASRSAVPCEPAGSGTTGSATTTTVTVTPSAKP